jgi:3-methyladenine DNA glycosylase/8-oxoguanine DNA glycosylase
MRIDVGGVWRATRTPDGPATLHLSQKADRVTARAWGPGAEWALDTAPALVGAGDDPTPFVPRHPLVHELHRRYPGLRLCRSGAVVEALVPTILEQKVVGLEARRSYAKLVRALGEASPAPPDPRAPRLLLPPAPEVLASTPSWAFHRFGVERKRAEIVIRACGYARRLEETTAMESADAHRRLQALPGIGPWTAAEVAAVALGDADAVSVGDYHLPHLVSFALAGEPRGSDERMLELLEPYRGQRARVVRLLEVGAPGPPRRGPRAQLRDIARL